MRYILIDLSSDNYLQQPRIFGGYAGEHNETILQVTLPKRIIGIEYSGYRFDFQTSEDNKISSPLIPVSKLDNGVLSFHLTDQLTVAGKLLFNIVATQSSGETTSLTSKTNMVALYIGDSPEGNNILPNPSGYKDEILEMIDARILEINPAKVDQTYNPESENAQSGVAVTEALNTKMNKTGSAITGEEEIQLSHITEDEGMEYQASIKVNNDGITLSAPSSFYNSIDIIGSRVEMYSSYFGTYIHGNELYEESKVRIEDLVEPTKDGDAVNLGYLNTQLGDIETALDSIIAIQETLIGGDSV